MSKQELRNANGNLRGTIDEDAAGVRTIRDANGRLLGQYKPYSQETRDANGRLVGKGDQLSSLLPK